jgi:uncharacterized Ntn-hydrolase superfamily protein
MSGEVDPSESLRDRVNKLTRMLCGLCDLLEQMNDEQHIHALPELRKWWEQYKEEARERQRLEKEAERQRELAAQARQKLTYDEFEALKAEDNL